MLMVVSEINQLRVQGSLEATDELWSIANGTLVNVSIYSGCISNGARFHTRGRDGRRKSQNSGVVVEGEHEVKTIDYYGYLCKVLELNYILGHQVVLFQCEWYNTGSSRTICSDPHFTSIDVRGRWFKNDPFVHPSQAKQVFYVNDTKLGDNWKVAERVQHRAIWDTPEMDDLEPSVAMNDAFQQDETTDFVPIAAEDPVDVQFTRSDIDPEIIPSSVVLELDNEELQDSTDDEEDESMGEPSEDEENELPCESDSDIDPDVEP
ncbi:hypothetical protein Vadar_034715 [Vaccinium darrowii]|uniref:Uncharacterized protein n=1 Tax=Vaccinium darrowii TaxID=229202 RepID=A0ACB7X739_9ERIC|nr:hypothetical protein Vadar_034715 [Vaccinium darrowii]